ncbi:uncharacterized protein ASCRUDRAFT_76833 [Ascoidea rubescens DSM 1968]|uniref:Uncharacterized protein n=1 Tax=Ascoidea rubescens DSM 1968 TaxID=1344418 RepID=A0A1D2VE40_9ASCO|nr:hypothetical protein ASCRUDRAFT_76833 [Ascoidea rubescens DSM 1968]ODV59896.1 hypothetical protein ASCRUDRAFT_76833 [Ascoidea rubescens DSM 1968]
MAVIWCILLVCWVFFVLLNQIRKEDFRLESSINISRCYEDMKAPVFTGIYQYY